MQKSTILTVIAILALVLIALAVAPKWIGRQPQAESAVQDGVDRRPTDAMAPSQPPNATGRWRQARGPVPDAALSPVEQKKLTQLTAVPYLQGYHGAPDEAGVTVFDKSRAFAGLNLVVSGHGPEASVMDMEGSVLHTWRFDGAWDLWPDASWPEGMSHWRRVHLYPNGDLLAIYDGIGMIKLNRNSTLVWHRRNRSHHDMHVTEDGRIHVLTRRGAIVTGMNRGKPIIEDRVTILAPDGTVVDAYSLVLCFLQSSFSDIPVPPREDGDVFHTNTIQVFDGSHAGVSDIFRKGNVLVSILHLDTVAIVDPDLRTIVWAIHGGSTGQWHHQHEPVLLDNGHMLLFDNNRRKGASKILEFEPLTRKVVWDYRGTESDPFYSMTCGTNQRLPNGNTLITESDYGRAFEVTRDGQKVWQYINPHRAGENDQLIATLLDVVRVAPEFLGWLK